MRRDFKLFAVVGGSIVVVLPTTLRALFQEAVAPQEVTLPGALISWLPILFIIVMWLWFMRRSGVGKHPEIMERSRAHMDRVERQNEQILAALGRIESALTDRQ